MFNKIFIFLNTVTTGSTTDSFILNFSLSPLNLINDETYANDLYVERTDIDINELVYDIDKENFNSMLFNSVIEVDEDSDSISYYKNHDNDIMKKVHDYLIEINEKSNKEIVFWVDNPVDWFFFANLVFPSRENSFYIPDFIDPYPIDMQTFAKWTDVNIDELTEEIFSSIGGEEDKENHKERTHELSIMTSRMNRSIAILALSEILDLDSDK